MDSEGNKKECLPDESDNILEDMFKWLKKHLLIVSVSLNLIIALVFLLKVLKSKSWTICCPKKKENKGSVVE